MTVQGRSRPRMELESVDGFDDISRMLDERTGRDCSSLDEHAVLPIDSSLPAPSESPAEWMLVADPHLLRAAIATELRTEIAEAVVG